MVDRARGECAVGAQRPLDPRPSGGGGRPPYSFDTSLRLSKTTLPGAE